MRRTDVRRADYATMPRLCLRICIVVGVLRVCTRAVCVINICYLCYVVCGAVPYNVAESSADDDATTTATTMEKLVCANRM